MRHLSANIRVAKSGEVNSFTGPPLNDLRILNAGPSQDKVEYSAIKADRPWQSCVSSGLDLSDGNCRFCLAASELLPSSLVCRSLTVSLIEMSPNLARLWTLPPR
jgi:hypothetical protein